MISPAVRLRPPPSRPVTQKAQSTAQPVCDERQTVNFGFWILGFGLGGCCIPDVISARASANSFTSAVAGSPGMKTASINAPSSSLSPYLTLPSAEKSRRAISGSRIGRSRASRSRNAGGSSVSEP